MMLNNRNRIYYSKRYSKLGNKLHTTIRRHQWWKIGQILPEFVKGEYLQDVMVMNIDRMTLNVVSLELLIQDTDEKTRMDVYDLFNKMKQDICVRHNKEFKPYEFDKDIFTIYDLQVVKQVRISDFF